MKGTRDEITRIMRKRDIRVTFSPPNSIRKIVDSLKDMVKPDSYEGVYSIYRVHVERYT